MKGRTETAMREAAGSVDGEGVGLDLHGFKIDKGVLGAARCVDGDGSAEEGEEEDSDGFGRADAEAAELFERVDDAGGGEAGGDEGAVVEGVVVGGIGANVFPPEQAVRDERDEADG